MYKSVISFSDWRGMKFKGYMLQRFSDKLEIVFKDLGKIVRLHHNKAGSICYSLIEMFPCLSLYQYLKFVWPDRLKVQKLYSQKNQPVSRLIFKPIHWTKLKGRENNLCWVQNSSWWLKKILFLSQFCKTSIRKVTFTIIMQFLFSSYRTCIHYTSFKGKL